jgi:glycosyltransferase involved in cell wall biosynthesis
MNNQNSIAIVLNGLYVGGAEKFSISLANKFVDNGFSTTIILFKQFDSPLLHNIDTRIDIRYIHRKSKFDFILNKQFDSILEENNINKVIIVGLLPLFLSRIFSFKRKNSVAYFLSLHSTKPLSLTVFLKNLIFLRLARKSDKTLFICNNQRLFYNKQYFFRPNRFDVIYNGVDIEHFKPSNKFLPTSKRDQLKIKSTDKVILLVATIRKEKGHDYAIESLKILHQMQGDKNNAHLVFIGGGDEGYINTLKSLVFKHSLQSFVHFEGNQNEVREYYEMADLFTLTSTSVETFSIAALEAMCYGLPISLTDIGGASEMVIEGKNGLLSKAKDTYSIANTWAELLDTPVDKNSIRKIVINNFSLDSMFEKYHKVITQ